MSTTTINAAPRANRVDDLKAMLESRRTEVVRELQDKIRAVRSDGIAHRDLLEDAERADLDLQDDIGFALIQLKTEMLNQIDSALRDFTRGTTATVSNAEPRSRKLACEPSRSLSAAETANKATSGARTSAPHGTASRLSSSLR